jgi:EmrB/QacA subfamily drug resistance transporter
LASLVNRAAYPWLVVGTVCIGAVMGQLDASIVQLSLPTLERAFDAPLDRVGWVAVAYMLAYATALPVFARLAEITGRKVLYLLGFALLGLFSALCGLAPSLGSLVAFRMLQGIGGALLGANSIVILVSAAGPTRRGQAMGIYAGAQAVGIAAGPALGGLLLAVLNWHWVFWVNVPLALAGALLGLLVVPVTAKLNAEKAFDWRGALLLMPALAAFMTAIMEVRAWGPGSFGTLACIVVTVVLLAGFVRWERRQPAPLIDPNLFRSPAFVSGVAAIVLSYAMLYGMFFAMSFALVRGYQETPLAAGLRLTIVPIALGLVAPFSGGLTERRPQLVMLGGMALCALAAAALGARLTAGPGSIFGVMVALAGFGAGLGVFIAPNNNATLAAAPAERSGEAGGLLNLMRAIGIGGGVASASSLLAWRLELATGLHERTVEAREDALLAAVGDVMLMLAAFAVLAAIACSVRGGSRSSG